MSDGCKTGRCGSRLNVKPGFSWKGKWLIPILHVRNPEPGHCLGCHKPTPYHKLRNPYKGADGVWLGFCEFCKNNLTTPAS